MAVILFFAFTLLSAAQEPGAPQAKYVVKGRVQDFATGAGVPQAHITLTGAAGYVKADCDTQEDFEIQLPQPGTWTASASADGYTSNAMSTIGSSDGGTFAPGVDSTRVITLILSKPARIEGRLHNPRTKKPLAGLEVRAVKLLFARGQLWSGAYLRGDAAKTGPDGRFLLTNLEPGDYVVDVNPPGVTKLIPSRQPEYSKEFPRPIGFARSQWPEPFAQPYQRGFAVASGANVNLGDIELDRQPLLRLRVALHSDNCQDGEKTPVRLDILYATAVNRLYGDVACNSKFTIAGLEPGNYVLTTGKPAQSYAETEVALTGDLDFDLNLNPPRPLNGRIRMDVDGAELPPITMMVRPQDEGSRGIVINPDGTFNFLLSAYRQCHVSFKGLDPPYVILEARYNGTKMAGIVFAPQPYATEHKLEVKIGKVAATLSGRVTQDDKPVPFADVIIAPWPAEIEDGYPEFQWTQTREDGSFEESGFRPGKYKVLAVSQSAWPRIARYRAEEFLTVLKGGDEIELPPSSNRTINLTSVTH